MDFCQLARATYPINLKGSAMKLKYTLFATILLIFAAFSTASLAAEEPKAIAPAGKDDAEKTAAGEAKKTAKKIKKHSHMEEKTGMPMSEPMPDRNRELPKNRHDHVKEKR